METTPLVMMALIGLAAGWIASQLVNGGRGDLVNYLVTGIIGAFVGGYIQRYLKLDLMRQIGNPLVEELVVATLGAVVVILLARTIAPVHHGRR